MATKVVHCMSSKCEFKHCQNIATFECWVPVFDGLGFATGLSQIRNVCDEHIIEARKLRQIAKEQMSLRDKFRKEE